MTRKVILGKKPAERSRPAKQRSERPGNGRGRVIETAPTIDAGSRAGKNITIVGIGASAGGLEAFRSLLENLPEDTGMAYVLVQHLDPEHESGLKHILSKVTALPVLEAANNMPIEPDHVYIIPPNASMSVGKGVLVVRKGRRREPRHTSIDTFFESLARNQGGRAIGVILSGTASDGTLGLEAIRAENGITFAQDASAKFGSMPQSAIAAGCVDFVLPPNRIAEELALIAKHPFIAGGEYVGKALKSSFPAPADEAAPDCSEPDDRFAAEPPRSIPANGGVAEDHREGDLRKILRMLHDRSGVDFSLYKPTTIVRRIKRRMVLHQMEQPGKYVKFLSSNPVELDALYSEMLIGVTDFFRDPVAFRALRRVVFPRLLERPRHLPVRIWVPGCSTGQEAYSIALAFVEFIEQLPHPPRLQVFATDLNEKFLEKGRKGFYAKSLVDKVPPELLERFFTKEEGGYRVIKSLREQVVFARQNIIGDPPFSRMDLISCRNLLIYFGQKAQQRFFHTMYYALNPGGTLLLGASETIGPFTDLFELLDKKQKIYVKHAGATAAPRFALPAIDRKVSRPAAPPVAARTRGLAPASAAQVNAQHEADRITVNRYAPPGVLVNADSLEVIQFRGQTSPYLEPPRGKASFDLLKMARGNLLVHLRTAIALVKKENKAIRKEYALSTRRGGSRQVVIEAIPLKNLKERYLLILFVEPGTSFAVDRTDDGRAAAPAAPRDIQGAPGLEQELAEAYDFIQSLREQHEATALDHQTLNDELQSANEELQVINEELQTSKEELESTNEELQTLNDEIAQRNQELGRLTNDLNNFHASIDTPIVQLDRDLRLRRFTPQAERIFNLMATDLNKPLSSATHNLSVPDLAGIVRTVITSNTPIEREVQDKEGKWYSMRIRPYLTLENRIDGAMLVLVDIDTLKTTEQAIREAEEFTGAIVDAVPPLLILDKNLVVQKANKSFIELFQVSPAQTIGRLVYDLGDGQWDIPDLRMFLEKVLPEHTTFSKFEVTHEFERLGKRTMLLSGRTVESVQSILFLIDDITERRRAEDALEESYRKLSDQAGILERMVGTRTAELRASTEQLETVVYSIAHDLRSPLRAMQGFAQMLLVEYASSLDNRGRDYAGKILDGAQRFDHLLRGLLKFSQASRGALMLAPTSLEKSVNAAVAECAPQIRESHAALEIERPLPVVQAHGPTLEHAIANLLSNALKFVSPGIQPRIRISAEERRNTVRLRIDDNGIGIPPEKHGSIFGVFNKLHGTEYAGTGIGLAMVWNFILRMGGHVGVEAAPQTPGSRFWIELPKPEGLPRAKTATFTIKKVKR